MLNLMRLCYVSMPGVRYNELRFPRDMADSPPTTIDSQSERAPAPGAGVQGRAAGTFPRGCGIATSNFFGGQIISLGRDLDADGRAGVAHLPDDWVRCAAWFIRICRPISNFSALAAGGTRG